MCEPKFSHIPSMLHNNLLFSADSNAVSKGNLKIHFTYKVLEKKKSPNNNTERKITPSPALNKGGGSTESQVCTTVPKAAVVGNCNY